MPSSLPNHVKPPLNRGSRRVFVTTEVQVMSTRVTRAILVIGIPLAMISCSTSREQQDYQLANVRVARTDIEAARGGSWWTWGVTVRPEQVFKN
jgi:hypothetical protein